MSFVLLDVVLDNNFEQAIVVNFIAPISIDRSTAGRGGGRGNRIDLPNVEGGYFIVFFFTLLSLERSEQFVVTGIFPSHPPVHAFSFQFEAGAALPKHAGGSCDLPLVTLSCMYSITEGKYCQRTTSQFPRIRSR